MSVARVRLAAGVAVDAYRGVGTLLRVRDDLATGRGHERVDPDHVALVLVALLADGHPALDRRVDHLVPGEVRGVGLDTQLVDHALAVPEQLGVGPERGGVELAVHLALSTAAASTPSVNWPASLSGNARRKPALAASAMNGGSRLISEIDPSLAASRRTSCSRCWVASLGSNEVWIRYRPPDASLHAAASRPWPPLSGLMYQFSRAVPPPLEQATSPPDSRARTVTGASAAVRQRMFHICRLPRPGDEHTSRTARRGGGMARSAQVGRERV